MAVADRNFVPQPLEPEIAMSSRKFGLNLVVVLAIAALFTGFWALINRPVTDKSPGSPTRRSSKASTRRKSSIRPMIKCVGTWRS